MPLKTRITAEQHAALSEAQQGFYTKIEGSEDYVLDVEGGIPDVEGLKRKNQELLDEKKASERKAREAAEAAARAAGDVAALEESWKSRLETEVGQRDGELDTLRSLVSNLTVGRAAVELAAELAVDGAAPVLLPHIERRLKMEMVDGTPKVRVLDAEGKPSAMTVDQLKEEIRSNAAFARIVTASKATGGGADGGKVNGGGASKPFGELTLEERTEWARRDEKGFTAAAEAWKAAQAAGKTN